MSKAASAVLAAIACCGAACAGPIGYYFTGPVSPYFIASGNGIQVIQGTRVVRTIPFAYGQGEAEGVFAISGRDPSSGTIRTRASRLDSYYDGDGGTYSLAGVPQGIHYATAHASDGRGGRAYDGTTDGQRNYFTDHGRGVYRADRDWQNPKFLFDPKGCSPSSEYDGSCDAHGLSGIAYDSFNGSLWISSAPDPWIRQYSMTGTLLSQFYGSPPCVYPFHCWDPWGNGALAFDPADQTLWLVRRQGDLLQRTRSGTLLQGILLGDLDPRFQGRYFYEGAEFHVIGIPEPATMTLVACGLALLTAVAGCTRSSRKR